MREPRSEPTFALGTYREPNQDLPGEIVERIVSDTEINGGARNRDHTR